METDQLKNVIESILLAAGRPLSLDQLLALFAEQDKPERNDIREAVSALQADYQARGIDLVQVGSGYRIQVRESMQPWVARLWEEKPARYSRALLETLALIVYRQPVTRGEIEEVRGVSVSPNIVRTLLERDWVRVVGHRDVPGRPEMFGTTRNFLDYFGLKKLDDLPPLADLSDWESLRVQLNLPEVEEDVSVAGDETADVPILYPEVGVDDSEPEVGADDSESAIESPDDEEQLVVSEWPDPNKPTAIASLETREADDDKDASANG